MAVTQRPTVRMGRHAGAVTAPAPHPRPITRLFGEPRPMPFMVIVSRLPKSMRVPGM